MDAAVIAYNSISILRQQMRPTWRVHGIFKDGGVKPYIIPNKSELFYWIRTPTPTELTEPEEKMTACFKAGATATGCDVEIHEPKDHKKILDLVSNPTLAHLYETNFTSRSGNRYFRHLMKLNTWKMKLNIAMSRIEMYKYNVIVHV